jgi:hypothetical protein
MKGNRKTSVEKIDMGKINYEFIDDAECPSKDCLKCKNFTLDRCKTNLSLYSAMPQYLIDQSVQILSPSAWKIFTFLNRRANFEVSNEKFGMCWFTFEQVEKATGVKASNMGKYIKELCQKKLITSEWFLSKRKEGFKTVHTATITWFKLHMELGLKFAQAQKIKPF